MSSCATVASFGGRKNSGAHTVLSIPTLSNFGQPWNKAKYWCEVRAVYIAVLVLM